MTCIDFDARRAERRSDPFRFKLGGETFSVRPISVAETWAADPLVSAPERFNASDNDGRLFLDLARVVATRLSVDDRDRWWAIFDDDDDPVDGADLVDVVDRVVAAMAED